MDYGTYKNNLSVVLTQACTDTDTVLHIDNAGAIPVLNEHGLYLTFVDTNEIVEVTSVDTTNNTITVVRGLTSFGGSSASSHNSGTKLSARVIAEHFDNLENNIENNEVAINSHINNTSNPHNVTASQVGAITKVEDDTNPKLGGDLDGNLHNIDLDKTTHANQTGIIYKNGVPFIHDFNYGDNGTVVTEGKNLFIGLNAGNFTMGSDATASWHGSYNIGIGVDSLSSNTTGNSNVGIGYYSLSSNTTGNNNVGIGYHSLSSNTTGNNNVGIGYYSLYSNTTGSYNIGIGVDSFSSNTTGNSNVGIGYYSLSSNTTGNNNVGIGYHSLSSNTTGNNNVGIGYYSLYSNTTGSYNIGIGVDSLSSNTTGNSNVGIGHCSLSSNTTGSNNIGIGYGSGKYTVNGAANETSSNSIYAGHYIKALADGDSNEIVIGYNQIGYGSNTIRLGNFGMGQIGTGLTPRNNHDLVIELTNNTTLRFKLKGTDGKVRTATITLS